MLNKEFAPKQRRRQQPAHDTGGDVPRPRPSASLAPQSPAPAAAAFCRSIIIVIVAEHLFDIIILLLLPARSQSRAWIPGRLHIL